MANEIPPDIVRWSGARAVAALIDDLVSEARRADPGCLCTFTSFPPTEFLRPQSLDFLCFNVYLHHRQAFKNYLARLQMIADTKPLVLAEFGMDSGREGESEKCAILSWQIEEACRAGLAGAIVFSYTDDWWRARTRTGGRSVNHFSTPDGLVRNRPRPTTSPSSLLESFFTDTLQGFRATRRWRYERIRCLFADGLLSKERTT